MGRNFEIPTFKMFDENFDRWSLSVTMHLYML